MSANRFSLKPGSIKPGSHSAKNASRHPRNTNRSSHRRPATFTPPFMVGSIFTLICISFRPLLAVAILAPIMAMIFAKTALKHRPFNRNTIEILVAVLAGCTIFLGIYPHLLSIRLPI
jgi:hypothetical protein